MGAVVIALLVGLWAAILLPGALRERRLSSPVDSVEYFERSMSMLAPARSGPGRHILVLHRPAVVARASRRSHVLRRRRLWLARLAAAVPVTLLVGLVVGGLAWVLVAVSVLALTGYVVTLARIQQRQVHARKVRPLRPRPNAPERPPAVPTAARPSA